MVTSSERHTACLTYVNFTLSCINSSLGELETMLFAQAHKHTGTHPGGEVFTELRGTDTLFGVTDLDHHRHH